MNVGLYEDCVQKCVYYYWLHFGSRAHAACSLAFNNRRKFTRCDYHSNSRSGTLLCALFTLAFRERTWMLLLCVVLCAKTLILSFACSLLSWTNLDLAERLHCMNACLSGFRVSLYNFMSLRSLKKNI